MQDVRVVGVVSLENESVANGGLGMANSLQEDEDVLEKGNVTFFDNIYAKAENENGVDDDGRQTRIVRRLDGLENALEENGESYAESGVDEDGHRITTTDGAKVNVEVLEEA